MGTTYRVRYRATQSDGSIAALVEDGGGSVYLFSDGRLQVRFAQEAWSHRVGTLLEHANNRWLPVESDARLPLAELPSFIADLQGASRVDSTTATS